MSPSSPDEVKEWHVLIMDIVDYSLLNTDEQRQVVDRLTEVVKNASTYTATKAKERMALPTGDGVAIAFSGHLIERPLRLAEEIHQAYGDERYKLKIGVDSGIAFETTDINGQRNMAGSGINVAQRVLSCCSGGHILVGNHLATRLHELPNYQSLLQSPHAFRVKHDKTLIIWNYFNGSDFGNPAEPVNNRQFEGDYRPLEERLALRGIHPAADLAAFGSRQRLQARLVMGDTLVEGDFGGFTGVYPRQTRVTTIDDLTTLLPASVQHAKERLKEPVPNKPKVFLVGWEPPIIDTGAILKLCLCASDYWTSLAVEDVRGELRRDLLAGNLVLKSLPRRLNLAVALVTADLKLVLCRRAGPQQTRYYADTWSIIGETMDAKEDRDQAGELRPERTVLRALTEFDELNLPHNVVEDAEIRFVAITTNWEYMLADLIALVKLRTKDLRFVQDCWTTGEHTALDGIPFSPDRCLQLITAGHYEPSNAPELRAPLNGWSRASILAALFSEFAYHRVMAEI